MKRFIFSILLTLASFAAFSQSATKATTKKPNVTVTADGNFRAIPRATRDTVATATGKTYSDSKGNVYPVLKSAKGRLFVNRTSKSGKEYRYYLNAQ